MLTLNLNRILFLNLILIIWGRQPTSHLSASPPTAISNQAPVNVNFCDLYESPEKYGGQLIRTKAILVAVIEPVIHGDSSFLISPACKGLQVMCTYGYSEPTDKLGEKLKKLFFSSKKGAQGRAEVVLQGKFEIAKKGGFDESSTIRYRIDLTRIESARKSKSP